MACIHAQLRNIRHCSHTQGRSPTKRRGDKLLYLVYLQWTIWEIFHLLLRRAPGDQISTAISSEPSDGIFLWRLVLFPYLLSGMPQWCSLNWSPVFLQINHLCAIPLFRLCLWLENQASQRESKSYSEYSSWLWGRTLSFLNLQNHQDS